MRVILTGANGFVGGHVFERLLQDRHSVITISRQAAKSLYPANAANYIADLVSVEQLMLPEASYEILVHAAGQAHLPHTQANEQLFVTNNLAATKKTLELAKRYRVKKFIYISTVAVLNNEPDDIYAHIKAECEKMVVDFCTRERVTYVIIRPVVVYGEDDHKGNVIKLIRQLNRGFFPLVNGGKNNKDMLYVKNLAEIINEVMISGKCDNHVFVARDHEQFSLKEICVQIANLLEKQVLLPSVPFDFLHLAVWIIQSLQKVGLLMAINAKSVERMAKESQGVALDTMYTGQLPFSTQEGLTRTVQWYLRQT